MKRVIAISTAALLGASLLASPVLAQVSVDGGVDADVGVSGDSTSGSGSVSGSGTGNLDLKTSGSANADPASDTNLDTDVTGAIDASLDGVISAMGNNSTSATSIGAMTEVSTVNVIRISEIQDADMDAFATAEADNRDSIGALQSTISGNAAVMAALEAQSIDPSTVVAADVAADGALTVYVR